MSVQYTEGGPSAVYKAQNLESPIEGCDTAYVDTRGYGYRNIWV